MVLIWNQIGSRLPSQVQNFVPVRPQGALLHPYLISIIKQSSIPNER
jgi:hypothetical protein